jgi:hypothetical protein
LKYFDDYKDSKTPEERQIAIEWLKSYVVSGDMAAEFLSSALIGWGISAGAWWVVNNQSGTNQVFVKRGAWDIAPPTDPSKTIEYAPQEITQEAPKKAFTFEDFKDALAHYIS